MAVFTKFRSIKQIAHNRHMLAGTCSIFSKLDGSNTSGWLQDGTIRAGSRNKEATAQEDETGIYAHIQGNQAIKDMIVAHPDYIFYGEWLTPHEIRHYKKDAWRKFYVIDVLDTTTGRYLDYDVYQPICERFGVAYVPRIAVIDFPSQDQLIALLEQATFLVDESNKPGEGIVIKNYAHVRADGEQHWCRLVTSEFAQAKQKPVQDMRPIEEKIIGEYCTEALIKKCVHKSFETKPPAHIRHLMSQVAFRINKDIVEEYMYPIVLKYKNPTVNFQRLFCLITDEVKKHEAYCQQTLNDHADLTSV